MEKFVFGASASNSLVEVIRDAILDGRMPPGTLISTSALAQELGVSRTPVREALLQLAQAGMVQFERNRGVRVVGPSIENLIGFFQVRMLIEVPLIARAAEIATRDDILRVERALDTMKSCSAADDYEAFLRADRDFHLLLLAIAESPKAVSIIEDLRNVVLMRGVGTVPHSRSTGAILAEHEAILDAVKEHDARKAATVTRHHILNTAKLLITQLDRDFGDYSPERLSSALDWVGQTA